MVTTAALAGADGDPFLGTTVAGRFVVLGRLGAGSMGTVYRARQEAMGRTVAIKILRLDRAYDAQAKARFTREAKAMSLLTSPHTVTVFDFGEFSSPGAEDDLLSESASLYLAMELLEGESLGERLKRGGRLPASEAVRIARHALLSLAEAHDKGIIHRDLKPDNLFLVPSATGEGVVCKVLDFGIAKVMSDVLFDGAVDAIETQAGTVFGTPRYMSPEQAQGKTLDARSDLYSLGVLLYQMLTGKAPFVDDDAVVVMARHIKTLPKSPELRAPEAAIHPELARLVMRALAKDPKDRPSSARAFMLELDRAVERGEVATGELGILVQGERGYARRHPALLAFAVFIVLLGSGALATRFYRAGRPPRLTALAGVAPRIAAVVGLAKVERSPTVVGEPAPSATQTSSVSAPPVSTSPVKARSRRPPSRKKYTRFE
jgi:serine/threonine-protein kinase